MGVQAMCTIIQNSTNFEFNYVLINDEFVLEKSTGTSENT